MIMFGPSLKSVPGCLVSIVPMLIGVPVALTPGFGPHEDVLDDPPLLPLELLVDVDPDAAAAVLGAPGAEEVLLLLLPHPASAISATTAASAMPNRTRGTLWYVLTDDLLSSIKV
jgi:hypothetical protein